MKIVRPGNVGRPKGLPKTGGRKPGIRNRDIASIWEMLDELKCDPLRGLAEIAIDPTVDKKLRARCYSDIGQYVYARRQSVAITDANGDNLPIVHVVLPDNGRT